MNFANAMHREGSTKRTENGAFAYDSTAQGALLDLFSQIGALRPRTEREIESKFAAAFREDKLLATKMLFYAGDIRQGGLGERRTFRICLRWLADNHPEIVNKNIELIPYFNRFDSWFVLCGTKCEKLMWENVAKTLAADMKAYNASVGNKHVPISLLAKWMPSENTSSEKTRQMAVKAQRALQLTPRKYRKMLSALRKHINVTERLMSAGEWAKIDYAKVPSYAMHNYGSAFAKHDYQRFNAYLQSVKKGEVKINASVLYPYDLVEKYMNSRVGGTYYGDCYVARNEDAVVEAQWKAMPNYLTKPVNAVVMADVSGSMRGRPMATSIGLATYFAQHNTGHYRNQYLTFTSEPSFINLREGASLLDCVKKVAEAGVGYSTNLEKAFLAILETAVNYRVPNSEMPKALVVISDMEIDKYMRPGRHWDFLKVMEARYKSAGYALPRIILWNVNARKDTVLSQDEHTLFVSGQSASVFKQICQNLDGVTAYDLMIQTLNSPAYNKVRI
jgi:hypothetical protein